MIILIGLFILVHILLFGVAVFVAKVCEYRDVIDDAEFPSVVALFVPLGVLVWCGAMFLADHVDDFLDDWEDKRRRR